MPPFLQQNLVLIIGVIVLLVIFWPQISRLWNPPKKVKLPTPDNPPSQPSVEDMAVAADDMFRRAGQIKAAHIKVTRIANHLAETDAKTYADALNNSHPDANQLVAAMARHIQNCPVTADPTPAAK